MKQAVESPTMSQREIIAHRALRLSVRRMGDMGNGRLLREWVRAIEQPCPECRRSILYCRCAEAAGVGEM